MPSFLGYLKEFDKLPAHLTFSLAALIAFYSGKEMRDGALIGRRGEEEYKIMDDKDVLEFFYEHKDAPTEVMVREFLSNERFFGQDLTKELTTVENVSVYIDEIKELGMRAAMEKHFA